MRPDEIIAIKEAFNILEGFADQQVAAVGKIEMGVVIIWLASDNTVYFDYM